ncbi:MAG: hypothetical protein RLZZ609_375 [Cyanobacteriota bacterium]
MIRPDKIGLTAESESILLPVSVSSHHPIDLINRHLDGENTNELVRIKNGRRKKSGRRSRGREVMVKINDFDKPSGIGVDGSFDSIGKVAVSIGTVDQAGSKIHLL